MNTFSIAMQAITRVNVIAINEGCLEQFIEVLIFKHLFFTSSVVIIALLYQFISWIWS